TFQKTFTIYPIKNLHHLYHKQPYPHHHFHKNHKPTSIINSQILIQPNNQHILPKPILLYINTNTKTTNPYYYLHLTNHHDEGKPHHNQKTYPLKIV
ncbi:Csa1 family protein, partial [Staphylococcus aureus]|uniref:Csa1 family protein n=1 Tax=Staphylococcus aureus TaxID=1280 RepID=UPI0011A683FA